MEVAALTMSIDSSQAVTAKKNLDSTAKSADALEGIVKKLAGAWAAVKFAEHAKEAFMAAARYETLGVVMTRVGANIGYTSMEMDAFSKTLQKTGISMTESRNTVIQMAGAQMDLANSAKLARIAQDAAVIGNINSSEAFQRLVHGIKSGETEILRTMGINVQFEQSYNKLAMTLGKTKEQLSDQEKTMARTNAVMDYGKRIAGAYEASMGTMGKQILSATRYVQDLTVTVGELIKPIGAAVLVPMLKWLEDTSKAMKKFIESAEGKKFVDDWINPIASAVTVLAGYAVAIVKFAGQVATSTPFLVLLGAAVVGVTVALVAMNMQAVRSVITLVSSAAAFVANTVAVIANGGALVGLSMAAAVADAALKKMGTSLAGVGIAAAGATIALAALVGWMYWYNEGTKEIEENNRKMEERIEGVLKPLQEQRDIYKDLVAQRKAYEDARAGGKSTKEAEAAAAATKQRLENERKLKEFSEKPGATPADVATFKLNQEKIQKEQTLAKQREELAKKEEENQKRINDLLKRKKDDLRKNNEEEQKSIVLAAQGVSAAYMWGLVHEKMWSKEEAAVANKRRINQAYRESAAALMTEAEALKRTAYEAEVYKKMRETGMGREHAELLASMAAENKAREEQRDLMMELRPLQIGERQFYLEQAKNKGVSALLADENWTLKQSIAFTTEMNKLREESNVLRYGEIEALSLQLAKSETMTAAQKRAVIDAKVENSVLREEMELRNQLAAALYGEAVVRDRARARSGMSSTQRASLKSLEDDIAIAKLADPLLEKRGQLAESERILGVARTRGSLSAKRLHEEERNLLMSGMALRAEGGATWAAIGLAFANTNDAVSDGLTNWIMNIGNVENKWLSLRDTMRNVFASMLADMAKSNIKQGLQPLMDGAGQLLEKGGNVAGSSVASAISGLFGGGGSESDKPSVDVSALTSQFTDLSAGLENSTSMLSNMAMTSDKTSGIMELLGIVTSTTSSTTSAELTLAATSTSAALWELASAAMSAAAAQSANGIAGAMAGGGYPSAGKTYLVGEKGPELFTPASSGTITPNDRITLAPAGSGGGQGGGTVQQNTVSIQVVIESSGEVKSTSAQASNSDAMELGKQMEAKIHEVLARSMEPGGMLHQNR